MITIGGRDIESVMDDLDSARRALEGWTADEDLDTLRDAVSKMEWASTRLAQLARQLNGEIDDCVCSVCNSLADVDGSGMCSLCHDEANAEELLWQDEQELY